MCELTVFLQGETVFTDAIYAKVDGTKVTVKDVLGATKVLENCKISEIDINSERLVLAPAEGP